MKVKIDTKKQTLKIKGEKSKDSSSDLWVASRMLLTAFLVNEYVSNKDIEHAVNSLINSINEIKNAINKVEEENFKEVFYE